MSLGKPFVDEACLPTMLSLGFVGLKLTQRISEADLAFENDVNFIFLVF